MADALPPPGEQTSDIQHRLAVTLRRAADALDESGRLAEEDAERKARQRDAEHEALERDRADRAHAAARKARINARRLEP